MSFHRLLLGLCFMYIVTMPSINKLETIAAANIKFSYDLFTLLSEDKNNNIFFSPVSAHAVLTMVSLGAKEETLSALEETLNIPNIKIAVESYKRIIFALNGVKDAKLHIANRIFLKDGFKLTEQFDEAIKENFLCDPCRVNFDDKCKTADIINSWVEEKTANKIKDLVQPNDFDQCTKLFLVNAIYFKGDWAYKFDKNNTHRELFYLNEIDSVEVDMMNIRTHHFNYGEDSDIDAKIIELPYVDKDLSLVVILPTSKSGIEELERKLTSVDLTKIINNIRSHVVNLKLPKFKIKTTLNLKESLTHLGLGIIFDPDNANFSGINPSKSCNLYVSEVVQKAFIEVNEEGAEAAAATKVTVKRIIKGGSRRTPQTVLEFYADHPFVFNLVHKSNGVVLPLFTGRICKFI